VHQTVEEPSGAPSAAVGVPTGTGPATSECTGNAAVNLSAGGTVTASDEGDHPDHGPAAVFDDHTGTRWSQGKNSTPWIAYEFAGGQAHVVTQYALTPAPDGSTGTDPVSWNLEGTNDAATAASPTWTRLHSQEKHLFIDRAATTWYSFENSVAYRRYRLNITENGGGAGIRLAELQLFGPGTPPFSVDDAVAGRGPHQFHYSAGWEAHGYPKDCEFIPPKYGCSSSWNKRVNETMTFTFFGSKIELFGVRYPRHGIAAVSIDGGEETLVDFYGPDAGDFRMYSSEPACPPARRVLRVRTTGDKNAKSAESYISLDRVRIIP
jgi:hypothetical protein